MRDSSGQRGATLVELMIALVIGLIIVAALFRTFVMNSGRSVYTRQIEEMQDTGRFGMEKMQRAVRMAGFSATLDSVDALDIGASDDRSLVLLSRTPRDCSNAGTDANDGIAKNTYRRDADTGRFLCQGAADPAVLADNVEAVKFRYGIDDDDDGVPNRFVKWSATLDSQDIVAIRFGFLIATESGVRRSATAQSFSLLGDEPLQFDDRWSRYAYETTIAFKNANGTD